MRCIQPAKAQEKMRERFSPKVGWVPTDRRWRGWIKRKRKKKSEEKILPARTLAIFYFRILTAPTHNALGLHKASRRTNEPWEEDANTRRWRLLVCVLLMGVGGEQGVGNELLLLFFWSLLEEAREKASVWCCLLRFGKGCWFWLSRNQGGWGLWTGRIFSMNK